jgi:hypothetical protein
VIKIFALVRKADDVDDVRFHAYWHGEFVERLRAVPAARAIRRIVLNQVIEHDYRPGTNAAGVVWSGVGEYYVDHPTIAVGLLEDPLFVGAATGNPAMIAEAHHFPVNELLMYDFLKSQTPCKVYGFFRATLPGFGRFEAHRYWGEHMEVANENKADTIVRKYVQNSTLPAFHARDPMRDYDGASCTWFDSEEGGAQIYKNAEFMAIMKPDEAKMGTVPENLIYVSTDEVQVWPKP